MTLRTMLAELAKMLALFSAIALVVWTMPERESPQLSEFKAVNESIPSLLSDDTNPS